MAPGYFTHAATDRAPGVEGRFAHLDSEPPLDAGAGVSVQVVTGHALMLSRVTMAPHGVAPLHTHDEEQMGLILAGSRVMELDGHSRQMHPGDVYHAPPGVPHGLTAGAEGCVVADLFSPPRRALLELAQDAASRPR